MVSECRENIRTALDFEYAFLVVMTAAAWVVSYFTDCECHFPAPNLPAVTFLSYSENAAHTVFINYADV